VKELAEQQAATGVQCSVPTIKIGKEQLLAHSLLMSLTALQTKQ